MLYDFFNIIGNGLALVMTDALSSGRNNAPTILVVEDEPMIRLDVADGLREFGFHVYEACDGVEALQILGETCVNLVFSDVQMPGKLDGFDIARHVRSSLPQVPVFLTSGFVRPDAAPPDLADLAPLVAKPYDLGRLVERFRAALDVSGANALKSN